MNKKTHVAFAETLLVAMTVTSPALSLGSFTVYPGIGIISGSFGAYIADVDMQNSTAGKQFPIFSKIFTHRGFTHTGTVVVGLAFLLLATKGCKDTYCVRIAQSLLFGFVFSYATHVIADLLNGKGVPLFWPIVPQRIHIMRIVTGGATEPMFLAASVILTILHLITIAPK